MFELPRGCGSLVGVSPEQRRELADLIRAARRAGARDHLAIMAVVAANAARQEAHYRAIKDYAKWSIGQFAYDGNLPRPILGLRRGGALNPITDKTGAYSELSALNQRSALMSRPRRERWQPS